MALDTFKRISDQVRSHGPAADILLCRTWVNNSFRRIAERRHWSWLTKFGQFVSPGVTNSGTVNTTNGSPIVTGNGTTWTTALIGQQFRVGLNNIIYTVQSVEGSTQLTLDAPFTYLSLTNVGYQIYQCYFTVPTDFFAFVTIIDPRLNWQLNLNSTQQDINQWDAQRASIGSTYAFVSRDYTTTYAGSVSQPVQILGTGTTPATTGAYQGPVNTVFTIQIVGSGVSGVATFQWKAGNGAFSPTLPTVSTSLQQGVNVYFPAIGTYNAGDLFTIQCIAIPQVGLPRYEGWPHYQGPYSWPFLYISRAPDLEDPNVVLPRTIRGDVLLKMALVELARWPGNPPDRPNPYYNLAAADRHEARAERLIMELETKDDEIFESDLDYSYYIGLPFAPFPWGDASWLQTHDVGPFVGTWG